MQQNRRLARKSFKWSYAIISGLNIIAGLGGYTVRNVCPSLKWWQWSGILLLFLFLLAVFFYLFFIKFKHRDYTTTINGKEITIKIGNIFEQTGWKVIPFNERFDTLVDDRIIAHNTLNGIMIDNYIKDLPDLQQTIINAEQDLKSNLKPRSVKGRKVYPLGRMIPYKDFLMLAFSHFDKNETAYIDVGEYETLMFNMWSELRNMYMGKSISIPLLGGGVTTFKGKSEKNYTELLRCMLCTLRSSQFQPTQGITIVLTKSVMDEIDMNVIREEF